ncbi:uncharacterized protein WM294_005463 [Sarcoramphus papa]
MAMACARCSTGLPAEGSSCRMETLQGSPAAPGSTGIRPEWKRGRSQAGKEEKRVGRLASCQPPRSPSGSTGSSCRQRGFPLTCGAGSPGRRSPTTMILWLWLCWGFSTSAGQPDSELMARYLEEKLMADYSIMEQVARRVPRQAKFLQRLETRPRMSEFTVKSTIISRYAFTTVSCTMVNSGSEAHEGVFEMQIPAAAFISNFTMSIGNKTYYGEVTGKEKKHGSDDKARHKKPPSPTDGR